MVYNGNCIGTCRFILGPMVYRHCIKLMTRQCTHYCLGKANDDPTLIIIYSILRWKGEGDV